MPEPFKNLFSEALIKNTGAEIYEVYPAFDRARFQKLALKGLAALELKERCNQITASLVKTLPENFEAAGDILLAALGPELQSEHENPAGRGLTGWAVMPLAQYVSERGLGHFDLSLRLLREMTMRSSSEFAIRTFLIADQARALATISKWASDPNLHVRRLVSEGTRPRLPWGQRLQALVLDPGPILPLLEALKDDPEEYVRRSVANNLNDIAKDHPDLVAGIAIKWLDGAGDDRQKLVRHGLRTLIKAGHKQALIALGYRKPLVTIKTLKVETAEVRFGGELTFEIEIMSQAKRPQALMIDYVIHHRKANGSTTPKVFKWKNFTLDPGQIVRARRKHSFRAITTRKYYAGRHGLQIIINGEALGEGVFELLI